MTDLKFRVKAHSASPSKTIVKARDFELIVDEPSDLGGTDQGANPVEYLLAAYAGCLNVLAHMCAAELGFELKGVKIDIVGSLNPARLFGQSFEERAGYKEIKATISPDCNADEATLVKWKDSIMNRCPVGDNIKNATEVIVEIK